MITINVKFAPSKSFGAILDEIGKVSFSFNSVLDACGFSGDVKDITFDSLLNAMSNLCDDSDYNSPTILGSDDVFTYRTASEQNKYTFIRNVDGTYGIYTAIWQTETRHFRSLRDLTDGYHNVKIYPEEGWRDRILEIETGDISEQTVEILHKYKNVSVFYQYGEFRAYNGITCSGGVSGGIDGALAIDIPDHTSIQTVNDLKLCMVQNLESFFDDGGQPHEKKQKETR